MERILQKLQHVTETRRQLLLEHASLMETLEEQQAGHIRSLDKNLANTHLIDGCLPSETQKRSPTLYDNGVENLRAKIWEVEKRYALQQLRHEELLLELEGIQKASRQTDSVFSRTDAMFDSKCGLRSELINQPFSDNLGRQAETDMIGRLYNTYPKSKILTIATESSLIHSVQSQLMGRPFSNSQMVPAETSKSNRIDL
ncbi:unnamed protein product [Dicrocoelium dendriticum]|nr:unnamed protein product [Dicrocoelium dendriticum]